MRWLLSFLLFALLGIVHAISSSGNRLLVVNEEPAEKDKYSKFWADLEGRGYHLTFESPKNEKLSLFQHGERTFDHIILLPPKSKGLGPSLSPANLLKFINEDGNILLTLSSDYPTPSAISSLLLEFDIILPPERTSLVVDHFKYDTLSASEKHDVLLLPQPGPPREDVMSFFGGDGMIAFPRAVAQELGANSALLAPVLKAPRTAYTYNPKDEDPSSGEDPFGVGSQISLVSTMQARNSARFTVLGSVESLENKWFDAKVKTPDAKSNIKTANQQFAAQLTGWTFKEVGVLKVGRVEHYLSEIHLDEEGHGHNASVEQKGHLNPSIYRVKNDVTFRIELSLYSQSTYLPLILPHSDSLQLEFSMLSPFHRLPLLARHTTPNSTIFTTTFKLPDQHGIFNFRVNYKRPFLTNVDVKREVTVRHFAHDEWPRSWEISGAWVWVAGVGVTVVGWLGFVGVWLWSEEPMRKGEGKKRQ